VRTARLEPGSRPAARIAHRLHCAAPAPLRSQPLAGDSPDALPPFRFVRPALAAALLCLGLCAAPLQAAPASVDLQELSSVDVQDALRAGRRTLIVPVGGTEQNGPHMALGKHNFRAQALAGRIAAELGDALVAPVVAYVPEGRIHPPTEHMRYAGTISIPDNAFRGLLDGVARSMAQHGFTDIVFIGDSGNYQGTLKAVAAALNHDWKGGPARAHYIAAYYDSGQAPYQQRLRERGLSDAQIGSHAGAADTALMLAVDASKVWQDKASAHAAGVSGDPQRASAELGRLGTELIVQRSVAAIRQAIAAPR
jgi:creatinine amidohydrolase/Fe(II)-dependent formamide hydrolase-like protein